MNTLRTLTTRDRAVIAYRLWRPAAPRRLLVLLHGVASNMTRWSEFVDATTLRNTWDILRLDLRGMGRSVFRGRIGMPEWCADLAAILAAEGHQRAVLAGHCGSRLFFSTQRFVCRGARAGYASGGWALRAQA